MGVERFQDLIVWQLADELRREIIRFTDTGRPSRDFKFRDQIRDAIASACRNSSEGFDRFRPAVFANHLEIARGSLGEVQDCLIDAKNRRYIDADDFDRMWRLSKRCIGSNTNLAAYLRDCAAKGLEPWRRQKPVKPLPDGEPNAPPDLESTTENREPEPEPPAKNREPNEPRTEHRAPRTSERAPRGDFAN